MEKSTLSKAMNRRNPEIFKALFEEILDRLMAVATLFAKSTDNIFFNEEFFGYLGKYLKIGSTFNFFVMLFIVYNIIKTACESDLFGLFSPRLIHLLRHKKKFA